MLRLGPPAGGRLQDLDGALRLFKRLAELDSVSNRFDCLVSCLQVSGGALERSEVFCDQGGVGIKTPQSDVERSKKFQTFGGPVGNISRKDNDRAVAEIPVSVCLYNAFAPVA